MAYRTSVFDTTGQVWIIAARKWQGEPGVKWVARSAPQADPIWVGDDAFIPICEHAHLQLVTYPGEDASKRHGWLVVTGGPLWEESNGET